MSNGKKSALPFAVKTILAEGANQGPEGMAAIASVLVNRATKRKTTPDYEAARAAQFTGAHRKDLEAFVSQQSPEVQQAAVNAYALAQHHPTTSATHYITTKLYKSSARPGWSKKIHTLGEIGDHTFLEDPNFH